MTFPDWSQTMLGSHTKRIQSDLPAVCPSARRALSDRASEGRAKAKRERKADILEAQAREEFRLEKVIPYCGQPAKKTTPPPLFGPPSCSWQGRY